MKPELDSISFLPGSYSSATVFAIYSVIEMWQWCTVRWQWLVMSSHSKMAPGFLCGVCIFYLGLCERQVLFLKTSRLNLTWFKMDGRFEIGHGCMVMVHCGNLTSVSESYSLGPGDHINYCIIISGTVTYICTNASQQNVFVSNLILDKPHWFVLTEPSYICRTHLECKLMQQLFSHK